MAPADVRLDRFTTRCRLPANRIRTRPSHMSQYVLVRAADSDAKDTLYLCRAALLAHDAHHQSTNHTDTDRFVGPLCFDASVRLVARASLYPSIVGIDLGFVSDASCNSVQWIPKTCMRTAVAVTLEALPSPKSTHKQTRTWLESYEYRQVLHETLQHHKLLCRNAIVQLPLPIVHPITTKSVSSIAFRVVSVYPDDTHAFVYTTAATRITLTTPTDAAHDVSLSATASPIDSSLPPSPPPRIAGLEIEQATLRDMILLPLQHTALLATNNIAFPNGLLLCGPPGVGKTLLVRSVVAECQQHIPLLLQTINGAEILSSSVGDAERTLRRLFHAATAFVSSTNGASVLFIDELDALCPARTSNSGSAAASRVVAQLLTLLDGADASKRGHVVVVGATNLPNAIDAALRRPGRFDRELCIAPPTVAARLKILELHTMHIPLDMDIDRHALLTLVANKTIGFVGADLAALCREALAIATTRQLVESAKDVELEKWWREWRRNAAASLVKREVSEALAIAGSAWRVNPIAIIPLWFVLKLAKQQQTESESESEQAQHVFPYWLEQQQHNDSGKSDVNSTALATVTLHLNKQAPVAAEQFNVTLADFEQALAVVGASSLRGATGIANDFERLGWQQIGGQDATKRALQQALEWPMRFPQTFLRLGVKPPRGILLYGPPGCSKSTIVRAAAHASGATFLTLSAAKVFSPFFGDAEAAVRQVFRDARAALPAIVFLDEIDVLVAKRAFDAGSNSNDASGSSALRVLSTLLNEMDGVEAADGLLVIGATNRPDCIDAALMRPGRFDQILFVDLPSQADRLAILQIHAAPMHVASDVDLETIAAATDMFSGAELENVCREAALHALRESIDATSVCKRHFDAALATATAGATPAAIARFHAFAAKMGQRV